MIQCSTVATGDRHRSCGTVVLDHLAADRAGFAGGQVTVIAFLQVDAHLVGGLHLELVHSGTGLGDIDLVAILAGHNCFSFRFFGADFRARLGIADIACAAEKTNMPKESMVIFVSIA